MVAFPVVIGHAGSGNDIAQPVDAAADPAFGFCHAQLVRNIDGDRFAHDTFSRTAFSNNR